MKITVAALICTFNDLVKQTVCYLQTVQADQGNLSHRAVQADRRYHADQPNPEGLKDPEDPERGKERRKTRLMCGKCVNGQIIFIFFYFSMYKYNL